MDQRYDVGATIFVPSADEGYAGYIIQESKGFGANMKIKASPLHGGPARELTAEEAVSIVDVDHLALQGTPDVVKLLKLSEAALLHNLRVRYARDEIYTRAGAILISVNPFKQLNIYTPERMRQAKVKLRPMCPPFPTRLPLLASHRNRKARKACPSYALSRAHTMQVRHLVSSRVLVSVSFSYAGGGCEDVAGDGAARLRPRRGSLSGHASRVETADPLDFEKAAQARPRPSKVPALHRRSFERGGRSTVLASRPGARTQRAKYVETA